MEKIMHKQSVSTILPGLAALVVSLPSVAFAEETSVKSVQIDAENSAVMIELSSSTKGKLASAFKMQNSTGIAVDILDADFVENWQENSVLSSGNVSNINIVQIEGDNGNIARVEIYLRDEVEHTIKLSGNQVIVSLTEIEKSDDPLADVLNGETETTADDDPLSDVLSEVLPNEEPDSTINIENQYVPSNKLSGPEEIPQTGPVITSLDFEQLETVSRVVIGLREVTDYKDSRPRPDTLLIDINGAFVPQSLSRVLDTGNFYSPIKMLRAYRTSNGARIAISLNEDSEYTIQRTANDYLIISVPISGTMQQAEVDARQASSVVSPDVPEEGISNAYQKEILIGEKGNTVDPQTAFGSGSGSSDPAAMLGMASGFMYEESSATSNQYTGKRISLDFVNADIHSIFRLISHVAKLNIVTGDDVEGRITVRLENVPWDQALAAVLQAKGLGSQKFGNIIRIAPIETIKTEQQSALEAKRAKEELTELQLLVLPLNYAQATEMQDQVSELLSARGTLQVDTRGNQLIIKETEQRLAQIRELVRHLDKQTPQVLIEARIVEASTGFTQMMGIQWGSKLDASSSTGYSTGLFFPSKIGVSGGLTQDGSETFFDSNGEDTLIVDLGAEASKAGIAFSLGSIPGLIDLDARLSAMETDGHGKVVSEPRITTLDNEAARISQGARVPYLSTSSGGTQVQFVEAALEMNVTPHITSDDQIFLDIQVTNNRPDFSQLVQGQPAIQIKEAQTKVLVSNGDTTVIGGVFSTETSFSQDRVPGLYKVPIVGMLFKNSADQLTRNEMMVFITPHIVTRTATTQDN
jgi:type IV pilus assembly protein PilQ